MSNFQNDKRFSFCFLNKKIWNNHRFTTVRNGIGNGIHYLKEVSLRNPNNTHRSIFNTKYDSSTIAIGKGNNRFHIFLAVFRNPFLIFYILRFPLK